MQRYGSCAAWLSSGVSWGGRLGARCVVLWHLVVVSCGRRTSLLAYFFGPVFLINGQYIVYVVFGFVFSYILGHSLLSIEAADIDRLYLKNMKLHNFTCKKDFTILKFKYSI
jgi:hypothetical protein